MEELLREFSSYLDPNVRGEGGDGRNWWKLYKHQIINRASEVNTHELDSYSMCVKFSMWWVEKDAAYKRLCIEFHFYF